MLLCSKTEFSVKPWSNKIVLELVWGYPDKYYLCFIHSNTYNYNPLALTCYDHQFIYMYRVFYLTLMVEIIIYMYVLCFCPYNNCCNHNKYFLSSLCSSGLLHKCFVLFINLASVYCNHTKQASRGSPCGVMITEINTITSTDLYHYPSHQNSRNQKKCYL